MNFKSFGRVCRLAVISFAAIGAASCVEINEHLGENFIPNDQLWHVYVPDAAEFSEGDIVMRMSDSLSAYSSRRFTFGSVQDAYGRHDCATSFTLVPLQDSMLVGVDRSSIRVKKFYLTAVRDTLSTASGADARILQNVNVYSLKTPLDTTVLYNGEFMNKDRLEKFVNLDKRITKGIPVYDGGDSLTFDFSKEFAEEFIDRLMEARRDTLDYYLEKLPGIYLTTDANVGNGGRINMFDLTMETDSYGYVSGNYAQIFLTADFEDRKQVDTSFLFLFGPASFVAGTDTSLPSQYAFNANNINHTTVPALDSDGISYIATDRISVEGGSGFKPVIRASAIKDIMETAIRKELGDDQMTDFSNIVINKATIILPYDDASLEGGWAGLDYFPPVLSPTVKLTSTTGSYVSYAGLTDSSIESENQGDINRSMSMYCPDMSHHIQAILKLDRNADDFENTIGKYDIWLLIMHEETTTTTNNNSYNDYYNNLLYNSYYNSMMYDPYGYGYGGYGYGYGYGGYGGYGSYGYNNYYNYLMMAQYASGSSSTTTTTSTDLDKDRFYRCFLNGPTTACEAKPRLQFTFSLPME